jgi:hypothetical protein
MWPRHQGAIASFLLRQTTGDGAYSVKGYFHLASPPSDEASFDKGVVHRVRHCEPVERPISRAALEKTHQPIRLIVRKVVDIRHAKAPPSRKRQILRDRAKQY